MTTPSQGETTPEKQEDWKRIHDHVLLVWHNAVDKPEMVTDAIYQLLSKERDKTILEVAEAMMNNRPAGYLTRDYQERKAIERRLDEWQKRNETTLASLTNSHQKE